jgi:hypothetical protein
MKETLQKVEINHLTSRVEVASFVSNKKGNFPDEGKVVGRFANLDSAKKSIKLYKDLLHSIIFGQRLLLAGSIIEIGVYAQEKLTHTITESDLSSMSKIGAIILLSCINYALSIKTQNDFRELENTSNVLGNMHDYQPLPYRKIISY